MIPATGGTATQLTFGSGYDNWPVWSPDGSQIAFESDRSGDYDIWVISLPSTSIERMLASLDSSVTALALPAGLERSLHAKLEVAGQAVDHDDEGVARSLLRAFVNQVEAQRGKHIKDEDATALIASAEVIIEEGLSSGATPVSPQSRPIPLITRRRSTTSSTDPRRSVSPCTTSPEG